jgi:hypothetical protein
MMKKKQSYDSFKVLKIWSKYYEGNDFQENHWASCLYSLDLKFLNLNIDYVCKI